MTHAYTIRSHQYFAADQPIGLVRCTSYWWYQLKNYQYGLGYSVEEVTIELVGYEIPQPDGSVLSGGDLNFSYAPSPPESLSVTSVSATTASLSWSSTCDVMSGFIVERKSGAAGAWDEIAELGRGARSYSDSTLVAENEYYYRVRAFNATGVSEPSNEAYRAAVPIPAPPSNLAATVTTSTGFGDLVWHNVSLTWNDNSDNEDGFVVQRSPAFLINWTTLATLAPNTESYTNAMLTTSGKYLYRVRAFNEFGDSAYSNVVEAVIP